MDISNLTLIWDNFTCILYVKWQFLVLCWPLHIHKFKLRQPMKLQLFSDWVPKKF